MLEQRNRAVVPFDPEVWGAKLMKSERYLSTMVGLMGAAGLLLLGMLPMTVMAAEKKVKPVSSCFVEAKDVLDGYKKGQVIFVDVRDAKSFARLQIPGSQNIPLFALKVKDYLKKEHVVLLNNGRTSTDLLNECMSLRGKGFENVAVMVHGLLSWSSVGGALQGDLGDLMKASWMTPLEYTQDETSRGWHVVSFVDSAAGAAANSAFPKAQVVKLTGNEPVSAATQQLLKESQRLGKQSPTEQLLVVDKSGAISESIAAILQQQNGGQMPTNVFFMTGGLDAYQAHQEKMRALMNYQAHPPKRAKVCNG